MTYKATNFAKSTLAANLSIGATSLSIQPGDVAKFPVINDAGGAPTEFTILKLMNSAKDYEVVKVTRHDTGAVGFTVLRAQEGTVERNWLIGDSVSVVLSAGVVTQTYAHPSVSTGAHAASAISVTPAGGIAAANVQAALEELDAEKSPVGHGHSAGAITVSPTVAGASDVQTALANLNSQKAPIGGAGTSGTWPISITGNAVTATTAANGVAVGMTAFFIDGLIEAGWLQLNGNTIGNAVSGATARANADTATLYTKLWNAYSNTVLPIQDSAGTPTTRGASAAADFAANKRMPLLDFRGYFPRAFGGTSGPMGEQQADAYLNHDHTAAAAAAGAHSHVIQQAVDTGPGLGPTGVQYVTDNVLTGSVTTLPVSDHTHTVTVSASTTGGTETRPKNIPLVFCVKY